MNRTVRILLAVIGVIFALALALLAYWLAVTTGVRLDEQKLQLHINCVTLFDRTGEEIAAGVEESVAIDALPDYLPNAFVAVEDKRFYEHDGLDFLRMGKAALKNLASFSFREGASTISQQLIKNTHLSGEKTISRKLKEIKLALALEKRYSKSGILELYLNSIYFGHSAFGLHSAARYYFGKEPAALSPAESAMLAALVRSPNRYSPFRDAEKCLERRNFVLRLMAKQGYITQKEREEAEAEPLPAAPAEAEARSAYTELAFEELARLFPDADSGDALRVYTYLDPALQAQLQATQADSDVCVLVRGRADEIKAFHSTCGLMRRLPASTIKPLAVYAPAIEEDLISPATPILDEKVDFGGYSPANYGGGYGGYMSARYALSRSVNVPAVKLLNELGVGRAADYLGKMDLPVPDEDQTLALALGGMREGFTLHELADGYAVFQNGGVFHPSGFIRRVEDASGKVLFERKPAAKSVFSPETAYLVNDMLGTAAREGTAKKLRSLPFEVCAKTGTGGGADGNTDAYTVAYTSEDLVAVWLGNRDNSPIAATGGGAPADITLGVMRALYEGHSPAPFAPCEGVTEAALDREEYEKHHRLLLADPISPDCLALHELFKKSALPEGVSDKFSAPKIEKPLIFVKNGAVEIILCQTEYYDYTVKRECDGEISLLYSGKFRKELFDNSVRAGKTYTYTVIPSYCGIEGEPVVLPSVPVVKS